jgi:ABC-type antimicrobial peptide transport system permease subunit
VAIVNRTLANRYFPGEDPVGKRIYNDWQPKLTMQIVGLADDIKEGSLEGAMLPALYVPFDQSPVAWFAILVRATPMDASLFPSITAVIHGIDPFISVSGEETMTERIDRSPSAYLHRSSAWLVGAFAVAAFLLSVVGLYGVVAYSVSQRTREIGVRMALGAQRGTVYRLILREAGRLIASGVALGLACSLVAARLLRSLLFGVRSWDGATLIGVAAVVGISAFLASYIPARRAAEVDPISALRSE